MCASAAACEANAIVIVLRNREGTHWLRSWTEVTRLICGPAWVHVSPERDRSPAQVRTVLACVPVHGYRLMELRALC